MQEHMSVAVPHNHEPGLHRANLVHSVPRAAFGVAMLTLLRVPF
jgi:hypothetical protein